MVNAQEDMIKRDVLKNYYKERAHLRFKTWREAALAAKDGVVWRRRVNGPIFQMVGRNSYR